MTKTLFTILLLFANSFAESAFAEKIAVIVNKNSSVSKLSQEQVKSLFLGQTRYAEGGKALSIGERDRNSPIYMEFYATVANMNPKEVSVHWAKKVFTGEAAPPARINGDDKATIDWLQTQPDAITYIYAKNSDSRVKIVTFIESSR